MRRATPTPLTHEQRLKVIHRSFPIRVADTGKIWGGVQVVDKFMRYDDDGKGYPTQGVYEGPDYKGLYADAIEMELLNIGTLLEDDD